MSNGALDAVLAAPPLKRITPAAQEAMDSVAELAKRQSEAKREAAQFSPVVGMNTGIGFSVSLSPTDGTLQIESPHPIDAFVKKMDGQFKVTIHF